MITSLNKSSSIHVDLDVFRVYPGVYHVDVTLEGAREINEQYSYKDGNKISAYSDDCLDWINVKTYVYYLRESCDRAQKNPPPLKRTCVRLNTWDKEMFELESFYGNFRCIPYVANLYLHNKKQNLVCCV